MPIESSPKTFSGLAQSELLEPKKLPQAGVRLAEALKVLLRDKDFNSITTAEISRTAQANEALLYRYFKDKRGLLHHVLAEYLKTFLAQMVRKTDGITDPREKLERIIGATLSFYDRDPVFAKILLVEVRNFPGYFESDTFRIIRWYTRVVTQAIIDGQKSGAVRADVPAGAIRDIILGSLEHRFLPRIIFNQPVEIKTIASQIRTVLFEGLGPRPQPDGGTT
ncbi:MAG: TetR/AcrR family transcriptional regulator [Pseudomonadota bacterium]